MTIPEMPTNVVRRNKPVVSVKSHGNYHKYLGIDFDDTIMDYKTELPLPGCRERLEEYKSLGCMITVWTNRNDQKYTWIHEWLVNNNIPFDRIICGKPFFDRIIDNIADFTGWDKEYI